MAQTKTIQLLRSATLYQTLEAAKTAVAGMTGQDGEIRLARYIAGTQEVNNETVNKIQSLICIYHNATGITPAGWTFIEDVSNNPDSPAALLTEINQIETSVGLEDDGSWDGYASGSEIVDEQATITGTIDAIIEYIKDLDKSADAQNGQVVTTVTQANGAVTETKANVKDLQLGGYSKDTNATGAIGSTDTVNTALSKLENAIAANDVHSNDQSITVADDSTNGGTNIEVNVDGTTIVKDSTSHALKSGLTLAKITSGLSTNVKEAYQLQDASGTQIGTQIDIYNDSALQEVYLGASTDTINASTGVITKNTVTDPQSMNFAYQLADGTYSLTKIDVSKFLTESEFGDGLQVTSGVVSVKVGNGLEIDGTSKAVNVKIDTTSSDAEAFLSVGANGVKVSGVGTAITTAINALDADLDASGTAAHSGTFVMSGVTEVDGVITSVDSVEVEAAGAAAAAKATIDAYTVNGKAINTSPVLDGGDINVDDDATTKETVAAAITRLGNAATASKTVVAEGTDGGNNMTIAKTTDVNGADTYTISLTGIAQDADVVKSVNGETPTSGAVTLDGADIALTGYAKGTAPASLDVAATDTVNAAIAKLEHQIDAAKTATTNAIGNLDGAATATAADSNGDFAVLTKVNEVDGVIQPVGTGANSSTEVTLKKLAGTGAAEDVTIADSGNLITATNVEAALQEIAGKANGALQSVSGSNAITVGAEDANHDQSISLKLDTSTGNTVTSGTTTEMLVITSNGLAMSDTWDCGTF